MPNNSISTDVTIREIASEISSVTGVALKIDLLNASSRFTYCMYLLL